MKSLIYSLVVALSAYTSCLANGFDPHSLPASVKWLMHVDMEEARGTQVGAYIAEELYKGEADRKMAAMATILRFDLRKDLRGITLFGQNDQPESAAVVLHGTFDSDALTAMVRDNDDYSVSEHREHTVYSWVDKGVRSYGAFHGERLVLSQGKDLVKQTLDVFDGTKSSLSTDSYLNPGQGIMVAAADMESINHVQAEAAMFKKADSVRLSMTETGRHMKGKLQVSAGNQEISDQLLSLAQGMIAFAQLNEEESPELQQLAQSMKVDQDGLDIDVSLLIPIADIMEMITENQGWKKEF